MGTTVTDTLYSVSAAMPNQALIHLTPTVRRLQTGPVLPPSWQGLWDDYEVMKRSSLSPRTLTNYRETMANLAAFLGPDVPPLEQVTRRMIASYIEHATRTASASTAGMRYRGLSAVINWLADPGEDDEPFIPSNPMKGLKHPKVEEQPVPVLTVEDIKRLVYVCRGQEFEDRRDTALIRFMYDTGARRGEVVSMQTGSAWLDLRSGTALVTGKTGPRVVSFGPKTSAALHRYIRARQQRAKRDEPALWVSRTGAPLKGNGVYQALGRRFEQAGIEATKKAHVFRHSFAHAWRVAGGSEGDLMALAGWKSPAMAMRYGKSAAAERARDSHRRIAPGEKV